MKQFINIIFLTLITHSVLSQTENSSIINLEKIIRSINPNGTIVYTDRVNKDILSKHFKFLKNKKIKGISSDTKENSIILTKTERNYILSKLKEFMRPYWKDSLFLKSRRINLDSAVAFSNKKIKEISNRVNLKSLDSLKFLYPGLNWEAAVFSFSDIIYLRNNSIFLNYCLWYDGRGGAEDLYFYRKEYGTWKRWILVSAGDW